MENYKMYKERKMLPRCCPKCAGCMSLRYVSGSNMYSGDFSYQTGKIKRTCEDCGFVDAVEPLDTPPKGEE